jgi:hypothetical protein
VKILGVLSTIYEGSWNETLTEREQGWRARLRPGSHAFLDEIVIFAKVRFMGAGSERVGSTPSLVQVRQSLYSSCFLSASAAA